MSSSYRFDSMVDSETNLVVSEDAQSKRLVVHGATLAKIVQKLTSIDCLRLEASFQETVFVTMHTFASPMYVLDTLQQRYAVPSERDVGADAHRDTYAPIQLRVIKLAKYWLDHFYWEYFAHDAKLLAALHAWLSTACTQPYVKPHVDALLRNIADLAAAPLFRDSASVLPFDKAALAGRACSELDAHTISLADLSPIDVARQIALKLHATARAVEWHTLNKHGLEAFVRQFNVSDADPLGSNASAPSAVPASLPPSAVAHATAYWDVRQFFEDEVLVCVHAAADGVTQSDAVTARQQALIQQLVDVALELFAARCYPGAFAIVAILHGKLSKKALKGAWKNVSKKKEARVAELLALASPKKHFKELRAHVAQADADAQPNAPWPPMAADMLLEVVTSAPDFLPSGLGDLIDMDKRRRLAVPLRRLRAAQTTPFPFKPSPFLEHYFTLTPSGRRHLDVDAAAPAAAHRLTTDSHEDGEDTPDDSESDNGGESGEERPQRNRTPDTLPAGKSRSSSVSMSSSSPAAAAKKQSGLGTLVRSLTRSQKSKREDSGSGSGSSGGAPAAAVQSGVETRNRSSSVGKQTRKAVHPAGAASTLRTTSRQDEERSSAHDDDDDQDDSDSGGGGGGGDDESDGQQSPRLRALRGLRRSRAAADAAASKEEQLSFVGLLSQSGSVTDAANLRSVLLQALKSSVAARHLLLQRLNAAAGGRLTTPLEPFDEQEQERLRSSNRVREALDLASAQTTQLNNYLVSSRSQRADTTSSSSPSASPRDTPTSTMFSFPLAAAAAVGREKRARSGSSLRSSSIESHSPPNTSGLTRAMALGPSFSMLSNSSASATSGGALSRRTSIAVMSVDAAVEQVEADPGVSSALAHLYPTRVVRRVLLDDKNGHVYGWPMGVPLLTLADDAGSGGAASAKSGSVPLTINAFRATADGVAVDDVDAGRPLPLCLATALDAAELSVFVRTCQLFHQQQQQQQATPGSSKVQGVVAARLLNAELVQRANENGLRVIVF